MWSVQREDQIERNMSSPVDDLDRFLTTGPLKWLSVWSFNCRPPKTSPKPPDERRSLRPHCRNAAAPVPPVQPELSAHLSRVSCDMTEIVQNQPNKNLFFVETSSGGASASPRPPWANILVNSLDARSKTPNYLPFPESSGGTETVANATPSSTWKSRGKKKQRRKLPNFSHQGCKHQRNICNNILPRSPVCMQNEMITCSQMTNQQQFPVLHLFLKKKKLFCSLFKGCFLAILNICEIKVLKDYCRSLCMKDGN